LSESELTRVRTYRTTALFHGILQPASLVLYPTEVETAAALQRGVALAPGSAGSSSMRSTRFG